MYTPVVESLSFESGDTLPRFDSFEPIEMHAKIMRTTVTPLQTLHIVCGVFLFQISNRLCGEFRWKRSAAKKHESFSDKYGHWHLYICKAM